MRVLHRLQDHYSIWPFQGLERYCVVEIYCRLFLMAALGKGRKVRDYEQLNIVLTRLNSLPLASKDGALSDDQSDALIAAAGLRHFASESKYWSPSGLHDRIGCTEGWTFGVV